jgi:hypothetical protein
VLIASAVALTVSLAACAPDEPAAAKEFVADTTLSVAGGNPGACTPVDAPMLNIPTASDDEPRMRIPQPQGWERSTEFDNVDESVRFSLVNTDLVGDEARDNAVVVTVEPAPDADAQTSFERTRADLVYILDEEGLPTTLETTVGTVCGLPAWTGHLRGHRHEGGHLPACSASPPGHHVVGGDQDPSRHLPGRAGADRRVGQPDVPARCRDDPDGVPGVAAGASTSLVMRSH